VLNCFTEILLGKRDNCQVAVSLSLGNHHASLRMAYRLYLQQDWADDHERRRKAFPQRLNSKPSRHRAGAAVLGLHARSAARGRRVRCELWQ
jgi:hypothetical protein